MDGQSFVPDPEPADEVLAREPDPTRGVWSSRPVTHLGASEPNPHQPDVEAVLPLDEQHVQQ